MLVMCSGEENRGGLPGIFFGVCVVGSVYVLEAFDIFVLVVSRPGVFSKRVRNLNEFHCRVLQQSVPR